MAPYEEALMPIRMVSPYGCPCPSCSRGRERSEIDYLERKLRSREEEIYYLRRELDKHRYYYRPMMAQDFGFLPEPKPMNKLTVLAKKILDKDTKTLIKAGILDDSLEITESGTQFLLAHYLSDNKVKLAKEARLKIKEDSSKE